MQRSEEAHLDLADVREALRALGRVRRTPQLALFLAAYWLYIDGIDTIQRMAVDYGMSIGLPDSIARIEASRTCGDIAR